MNASERKKLGERVAYMLYSYDSERQSVAIGEEILEDFPCLQNMVNSCAPIVHTNNMQRMIVSGLISGATSNSLLASEDMDFYHIANESDFEIWSVCSDYCDATGESPEKIAERFERRGAAEELHEFVKSPAWVEEVHDTIVCEKAKKLMLGDLKGSGEEAFQDSIRKQRGVG